jgi:multidrug resistance efflux pump
MKGFFRRGLLLLLAGAGVVALLFYSQHRPVPFRVSGFVEADEIRVGSRVGGRVATVRVEEGSQVCKGDLLVELEPFDLLEERARLEAELAASRAEYEKLETGNLPEEIAQAKARRDQIDSRLTKLIHGPRPQELETARAHLKLAEAELELAEIENQRAVKLFQDNVDSREVLDRTGNELKTAQAAVQVRREELGLLEEGTRQEEIQEAKAQLDEADQALKLKISGFRKEDVAHARAVMKAAEAKLRAIEKQIEELAIRAPVKGVVEAVELQPGDLVAINAPVLSIMDVNRIWVRAYVPENRLYVQLAQKVPVLVDSFPNEEFSGRIIFIAREAEFTPANVQTPEERSKQVFRIKVLLEEGKERLRPGMAADIDLSRRLKTP